MGHWEIEDINYTTATGEATRMEFKISYTGMNIVDAYDEFHRAINYLNSAQFASHTIDLGRYYSINPYDIRSMSFSLKPDAIDIRRKIKKVIFNDPATIIIWKDGAKTVVKAGEGEKYDPEKGLAMAISKYALGNEGNYYETFKKWLPEKVKIEWEGPSPEWSLSEALSWFKDLSTKAEEITEETFAKYMNPPEEENDE